MMFGMNLDNETTHNITEDGDRRERLEHFRQSQLINEYLKRVRTTPRAGWGRSITEAERDERLRRINERLQGERLTPVKQIELLEKRRRLERMEFGHKGLEAAFVAVAADFAQRKGISYETFREFGVPTDVLRAAGIHQ
jgi:hypothetical protein